MITHIKGLLFQNDSIIVTLENVAVNIRPKNINKGYFIAEILKQEYNSNVEFPELIFALGNQDGDEEMFKYLNYLKNNYEIKKNLSIYSVTIGNTVSNANYFIKEMEILEYLENLNKENRNDGSSSKYSQSQDIYNCVEQSEEYEL